MAGPQEQLEPLINLHAMVTPLVMPLDRQLLCKEAILLLYWKFTNIASKEQQSDCNKKTAAKQHI